MPRPLPSPEEALAILKARRTRPPPRPPPQALRGATALMKALGERFDSAPGPDVLRARWRDIVGEALAGRSEPVKLVKARTGGSTLELKVAGPVAALIQHQAPQILSRLNLYLGEGTVTRLRIVQGPLSAPVSRPASRATVRRAKPPLDAAAERALADSLADAPDGPLKRALLRLGREVLRNPGGRR